MFTGFPEETIQFFLDIRFHNSISYFEENRERFRQDVQAPFYAFIEELAPAMRKISHTKATHQCRYRLLTGPP